MHAMWKTFRKFPTFNIKIRGGPLVAIRLISHYRAADRVGRESLLERMVRA